MKAIQLLKKPFDYYGGSKLLMVSVALLLPLILASGVLNIHFTGSLNLHFLQYDLLPYSQFIQVLFIIFLFSLFTGITSYVKRRSFPRIIDLVAPFTAARAPLLFTVLFFPLFGIDEESMRAIVSNIGEMENALSGALLKLVFFALCALPFIIYTVYLHYSVFSLNTAMKGAPAVITFTALFLIIEIIVQVTFYTLFIPIFS